MRDRKICDGRAWHGGRVRGHGGIQKRTILGQILGVISDLPGIAQASLEHRSSIARESEGIGRAAELLDHVVP